MKIPIKILIGIFYIITKWICFIITSIIIFVWDMNLKNVKELYEDHKPFYVSYCFYHEMYRYNTLLDYVYNRKDYSKSEFKDN